MTVASIRLTTSIPATLQLAPRSTYDAGSRYPADGLGKLVLTDDAPKSGDAAVDAAHDNAGAVSGFLTKVLERDSIDGYGMRMVSVAHYGKKYNNAFWDGEKMTYGDGDGVRLAPLSFGLDVVGHEMFHGVTQNTSGLEYEGQSGALNESWSDVFGEIIEQYTEQRESFGTPDAAAGADWLIGEDVWTPGVAGDALRSMKAPGTGYKGDPQPDHMSKYKDLPNTPDGDHGGVHINSGIPNKAAYLTAVKIGSEKLAKIWYKTMVDYLRPTSSFADAAAGTIAAADKLYGQGSEASNAVRDAWNGVGILASESITARSAKTSIERVESSLAAARNLRAVHAGHTKPISFIPDWLAH